MLIAQQIELESGLRCLPSKFNPYLLNKTEAKAETYGLVLSSALILLAVAFNLMQKMYASEYCFEDICRVKTLQQVFLNSHCQQGPAGSVFKAATVNTLDTDSLVLKVTFFKAQLASTCTNKFLQ